MNSCVNTGDFWAYSSRVLSPGGSSWLVLFPPRLNKTPDQHQVSASCLGSVEFTAWPRRAFPGVSGPTRGRHLPPRGPRGPGWQLRVFLLCLPPPPPGSPLPLPFPVARKRSLPGLPLLPVVHMMKAHVLCRCVLMGASQETGGLTAGVPVFFPGKRNGYENSVC